MDDYVEMKWNEKDTLTILLDGKKLNVEVFKIKQWSEKLEQSIEKYATPKFSNHTKVTIETREERSPDATGLIAEFLEDLDNPLYFNKFVKGLYEKWEKRLSGATDK